MCFQSRMDGSEFDVNITPVQVMGSEAILWATLCHSTAKCYCVHVTVLILAFILYLYHGGTFPAFFVI